MSGKASKLAKGIISMPPGPRQEIQGLGSMYFDKMHEFKHDIGLTDPVTGGEYTYQWLFEKSIQIAISMRARGVKPNDIIVICSSNDLYFYLTHYAIVFLGAIPCNFYTTAPKELCVHCLKVVCPKMIFVACESMDLIESSIKEAQTETKIVVYGDTSVYEKFSKLMVPSPEESSFTPYEINNLKDTAAIVYTSGSTGTPKAVCLTHYGLIHQTYKKNFPNKQVLLIGHPYGLGGLMQTITCVLHGLNGILCSKFDRNTIWDTILKYKVNYFSLAPILLKQICNRGISKEADTSELIAVMVGGNVMSEEALQYVKGCLPNTLVYCVYGLTEMSGLVLTYNFGADKDLLTRKPLTLGKPKPGIVYKIVDPNTEEILGPNQTGELRVKSDLAMKGYYKEDSSYVWDDEGYLKTGDLFYYDEENCFFFTGRIKNMIKYQQHQVCPVLIENVFYTHPAVEECLVSSRPDPLDDDHLVGVVKVKEEYVGKISEDEMRDYVDAKVSDQYKLRGGVVFVQSIPYLHHEVKPDRLKIAKMIRQGML